MKKTTKRPARSAAAKRAKSTKPRKPRKPRESRPHHRFTSLATSADDRLQRFDQRYADQRENFIERSAIRLIDAWHALPSEVRNRFNELLDKERGR